MHTIDTNIKTTYKNNIVVEVYVPLCNNVIILITFEKLEF